MEQSGGITVAQHLETMGVDIVRGGFASWVRRDLGFQGSDESIDRALDRVRTIVATGALGAVGAVGLTVHELTGQIAAALPTPGTSAIDAFGGSAWTMD